MKRTAGAVSFLVLIVMAMIAPAAADPEIGLSRDGATFAATLPAPLFDSGLRWVPGDSRTASFYVRNQSGDSADLAVDVLGATIDSLLETGDLTISARVGEGAWRDVSAGGTHRLVSDVELAAGGNARVDIAITFDPQSSNHSQRRQLDLDFGVRLTQNPDQGSGNGSSILPDTGAPVLWSLIISLALIAGGTILVRMRQKEEDTHVQSSR